GVEVVNGTLTVTNSIAGDNTAATNADIGGSSFDVSFSLIEGTTTASVNDITGNLMGVDPQLTPLANNGGPTQTQRPGLMSPVINAADPGTTVLTDQRGQQREYPTRADMGAVELIGGIVQFNPAAYNVAETGGSIMLTVVRDVGTDPASVDFTTN